MKKILIAILLIGVISSCNKTNVKTTQTKIVIDGYDPLEVATIEGCEYFKTYSSYGYFSLTHKGNCKSSIHKGGNK